MSSTQILVLGALAGIDLHRPSARTASLPTYASRSPSGMATGILLFLLYDVLAHGVVPVEEALERLSTRVARGSSSRGWPRCSRSAPVPG